MNDSPHVQRLVRRDEVPVEARWRLEDIYAGEKEWEADFQSVSSGLARLRDMQGTLGTGPRALLECLQLRDRLLETFERLYGYAQLKLDEDTTNAPAQARLQRARRLAVELEQASAYIEPELLALPDGTVEAFLSAEPGLELYRHYLQDLWRRKPHTLDAAQENLLARVRELARIPEVVYGAFKDADLRFPTIQDEKGEAIQLSEGRFRRLMEHPDRRVRREAFTAFYETIGAFRNTFASTLEASVRKDVFYAQVRRYPSALAAALHPDNVPLEVYDNLIGTVRSKLESLHRYLRLRRRILGVDELHMYDLYVPLVPGIEWKMDFEEAKGHLIDALRPLGPEYGRVLEEALQNRWIDSWENEGKRSGAYCVGIYGVHPFILMNRQGTLEDAFTLAHEIGHALHDVYAHRHQPYIYSQPSIFTAEVASTLNELMLYRHLQGQASDVRMRAYLITEQLELIRTTVFRQVKFAEFEKLVHERAEAGEPLTWQELCDLYRSLNKDYYGAEAVIDEGIAMEWARIPHFYSAFYVYQYATGLSAAVALSHQILEEGEPAVRRYLEFLSAGSSDHPIALLRRAGVDLTTPDPVLRTLDLFDALLDALERELSGGQFLGRV